VRFLHDNGTLLHYEDPLLSDFYFVDPQWLCDMLAHIITVREINPFVREGQLHVHVCGICLPVCLSVCQFAYCLLILIFSLSSVCLSVCLSVSLPTVC